MSSVMFCDLCGVELGKGKGIYRVQITMPGESWYGERTEDCRYELCVKCAKPVTEWRRVNPKRKMMPVEEQP
jgi:hypothetical protein